MSMSKIPVDEEGELFISGLTTAVEQSTSEFDRVVSVHTRSVEHNVSDEQAYSWYDIETHSHTYSYRSFERAADEVCSALEAGERILLHDGGEGMDEAVSVALAVVGRLKRFSRVEAMQYVHYYRIPDSYPSVSFLRFADRYLRKA